MVKSLILILAFGVIIGLLILKIWPKSGKFGINTKEVVCPSCSETMPRVRKPANLQQALWGGWTCPNCGAELDKYGKVREL